MVGISGSQRMRAADPVLMSTWPCRVVVTINKKRSLVVSVEDRATFEIVLHRTWKGSAIHQDFLGFYVLDSSQMSARTQGLLGMTGWAGRTVSWCSVASVCSPRAQGQANLQHNPLGLSACGPCPA